MVKPPGTYDGVRARWTTAMTGMFEAYPVNESERLHGSGWSRCRARVPQAPSVTRCARCLAALAAVAAEHGGRIIYRGIDFRSKRAERQLANLAYANQISPLNAIFENILLRLDDFLLPLYFCVRLRLPIRR